MHTPESFEMKMGLGHRLYEEFRVTRDPITKLQVWEKAVAAANEVPVPEGMPAGCKCCLPGVTTPPHLPAWWLLGLGPLPRTPERSLSSLGALPWPPQPASGRPKLDASLPWRRPSGVLSIPTLCTQPQPDEIRLYAELLLFVSQGAEKTVTAAMHDLFHRAPAYPQLAGLCDVLKAPASSARKMQEVCHLREGRDEAPLSAREVSQLVARAVYPA